MMIRYFVLFLVCFVSVVVVSSRNAYGYIDPGTGSFIIQIVIAGLVGSLFFLKIFWGHVKRFLSMIFTGHRRSGDE